MKIKLDDNGRLTFPGMLVGRTVIELGIRQAAEFLGAQPDVKALHAIGSATYLDAVQDIDFAVCLREGVGLDQWCAALVEALGFERCSPDDTYNMHGGWTALRKGYLNLMVTQDTVFFDRYVQAGEVCKFLKIEDKGNRIAVCRIVRDGLDAAEATRRYIEDLNMKEKVE